MRAVDPLTHTLLGAGLGYAVFGRKLGRTAAAAGALAALLPDADVFIRSATDPLLAIEYHRHFTHSLFFAPIGAALVMSLWLWRAAAREHWKTLWACTLLAYVSHTLLDAATSYGTLLFWPLSRHRFGWDFVSVVDLLMTVPLAIGVGWGVARQRQRAVIAGLAIAMVYLGSGIVQHQRAAAAQRQLAAARGHIPERAEVMPTLANNLVWRALYVHDGLIYSDRIRVGWLSSPTVREGWSLPLIGADELNARETTWEGARREFARFRWFAEGWIARSPSDQTVLGDMRYSLSAEAFDPIWGIRFAPSDAPSRVEWVNRTSNRRIDAGELWREIAGRDARFQPPLTRKVAGRIPRCGPDRQVSRPSPNRARAHALPIQAGQSPDRRPPAVHILRVRAVRVAGNAQTSP